ncbi:MAG: CoA-binding protein [Chitinophagales bacterium]|nr:CoA-binding protein [Chitinophagales bacterium]
MQDGNKKTLVLGASTNPERYSNIAIHRLLLHGHDVVPVGIKRGAVAGIKIINEKKAFENIDTVTLYLNPQRQQEYYDYILSLKPKRIVFNPGAENEELENLAKANGIEATEACTLVLLSTGQY